MYQHKNMEEASQGTTAPRPYAQLISLVKDRRCALMGLGVSNLPLAFLLLELAMTRQIIVYDKRDVCEIGESAKLLAAQGVRFACEGENIDADVIFRSPGIRPDREDIARACRGGAVLVSEIELLLGSAPCEIFAITGSDGKTTTTTLCGKFLEECGRVFVGGNIGTPLLCSCAEMAKEDSIVLELSSFQLMSADTSPRFPCAHSVAITNITPNHLNWHRDMQEYVKAKRNIVGQRTRRVVLNADNPYTKAFGEELVAQSEEEGEREIIFFSSSARSYFDVFSDAGQGLLIYLCDDDIVISDGVSIDTLLCTSDILIKGRHNVENYMAAIGLTYKRVDSRVYAEVARSFGGVEHRLEHFATREGVEYYNGSIDSSPTRTIAALSALCGRDIVIICGGYDKNLDYAPLAPVLCDTARVVVLTGQTGGKIGQAIRQCDKYSEGHPEIIEQSDFDKAVIAASAAAREGGCVLLSPASASFDRFKNFEHRGRYFKELVISGKNKE